MRDALRITQDWLELAIGAGLVLFAIEALRRGRWLVALLALPFLLATFWLWRKQARARFCVDCRAPMRREAGLPRDHGKICYVCETCGRRNDSGVQWGYPE